MRQWEPGPEPEPQSGDAVTASPQDLHWERFRENPDDRAAFEMLEEHLFMEADWSSLADLYQRRQAAPSLAERPRVRAELTMRLGQLYEDRLGDGDAAVRAYTEAVRLDPTLCRALRNLRRIYSRRRSWEAVLQIGEQEAALAQSGEERARIFSEMGDIWHREIGDRQQADELYARARIESGGVSQPEPNAPAPDADPEETHVQSAWIAAARGDSAAALSELERALERDPTDTDALDMMLSVLDGAERHRDMSPLLERRAALAIDAETRSAVLVRLGEILDQLGDGDGARDAYERALAAHPEHADARAALLRIYRSSEAWSPLRSVLEAAAEASDGSARVEILYELAGVTAEELGDPDAAHDFIEQALELAPDDPRLQSAHSQFDAEQVALTMPEWDDRPEVGEQRSTRIIGVLERRLAAHEAEGEGLESTAVALRIRIAELHGGPLGNAGQAVASLEPALEEVDALLEVAPMLAGLYEQLGRMEPLIELAKRAAQACDDSGSRVFWWRRAADAARAMGDPGRAIGFLRALLVDRPHDRGACSALIDLYRSRGDVEPLVALLRDELPNASEDREVELQLELATLLSESLDDPAGAIPHLRRCIALEPHRSELLDWALAHCAASGGPLAQLDLLDDAADRAPSDAVRAGFLARRGAVLADELSWQDEAVESWRAALALDPQQPLARQRMEAGTGA
jgi:tetratricopeptide (TPR) repeat protein